MKLLDLLKLEIPFGAADVADGAIELAAGEVKEIEAGMSGTFRPRRGPKSLTLTKADLAAIAKNFDTEKDHKIKLGHTVIETNTPDMGDVVSARYNAKKDRLMLGLKATESGVEKNRKGEFHQPSMELTQLEDGTYTLGDLTFLGAHNPAIRGLKRIELSEGEGDGGQIFVCMADEVEHEDDENGIHLGLTAAERKSIDAADFAQPPDRYPIDTQAHLDAAARLIGKAPASEQAAIKKRAIKIAKRNGLTLPQSWESESPAEDKSTEDTKEKVAAAAAEEERMDKEKLELAEAENKRLKERVIALAKNDVTVFMASEAATKKIPLPALKGGNLERILVRLAEMDAEGALTAKIQLAAPTKEDPKKEGESSLYEGLKAIFLGFPDKTTADETREIATEERALGEGEHGKLPANVTRYDFAAAHPGKVAKSERHEKILAYLAAHPELAKEESAYTKVSESGLIG